MSKQNTTGSSPVLPITFDHHRVLCEFTFPFRWLVIRSLWIRKNRTRSNKRSSPSTNSTESHSLAHPTRKRRLHSVWECISVAARGAGWRCAYQCDSVISSMMAVVPAAWQRCDKKRLTLTLPLQNERSSMYSKGLKHSERSLGEENSGSVEGSKVWIRLQPQMASNSTIVHNTKGWKTNLLDLYVSAFITFGFEHTF